VARFGSLRLVFGGALVMAAFTVAMSVQYLVGAVGVVGILRTRRLARRRLAEQGVVVRPIREVLAEKGWFSAGVTGKGFGLTTLEPKTARQRRT
jgi:hypothetical protein